MRLDYEAAEKAYRANIAEQDRSYMAGGTVKVTPVLKATATSSYLRISLESLRHVHKSGWRATASTRIVWGRARRRLEGRPSWLWIPGNGY
jgi:hypothetical protein